MLRTGLLFFVFIGAISIASSQEWPVKTLFENSLMEGDYYYSETDYSGNSWVKNIRGKLPVSVQRAYTPGNGLELYYQSAESGTWTASIQYQSIRGIDSFQTADHLSFWIYNETSIDTNYFENNRRIAEINLRYCIENPENHEGYGDDFWGLTASDGPGHYSANEPKPEKDEGKMTPTGALASFPYTPEASLKALKNYYRNYGHFLYGYYGFRDAFNLDTNWCSPIYMGLNQAPIVAMIENHRSGLLWDLLMSAPEVKNTLNKIKNKE